MASANEALTQLGTQLLADYQLLAGQLLPPADLGASIPSVLLMEGEEVPGLGEFWQVYDTLFVLEVLPDQEEQPEGIQATPEAPETAQSKEQPAKSGMPQTPSAAHTVTTDPASTGAVPGPDLNTDSSKAADLPEQAPFGESQARTVTPTTPPSLVQKSHAGPGALGAWAAQATQALPAPALVRQAPESAKSEAPVASPARAAEGQEQPQAEQPTINNGHASTEGREEVTGTQVLSSTSKQPAETTASPLALTAESAFAEKRPIRAVVPTPQASLVSVPSQEGQGDQSPEMLGLEQSPVFSKQIASGQEQPSGESTVRTGTASRQGYSGAAHEPKTPTELLSHSLPEQEELPVDATWQAPATTPASGLAGIAAAIQHQPLPAKPVQTAPAAALTEAVHLAQMSQSLPGSEPVFTPEPEMPQINRLAPQVSLPQSSLSHRQQLQLLNRRLYGS